MPKKPETIRYVLTVSCYRTDVVILAKMEVTQIVHIFMVIKCHERLIEIRESTRTAIIVILIDNNWEDGGSSSVLCDSELPH